MAHVLFFGPLRDAAGCSAREVQLDTSMGLAAFRKLAASGDEELERALAVPSLRVAINAEIIHCWERCIIAPKDEVAFLPPFSGG